MQSISSVSEKRGKYQKYSKTDRFGIGKYATENGNSKCLVHFKRKFPGLKESTVRTFKKQYQEELKQSKIEKWSPNKVIKAKRRGRPLLLGGLDAMVQKIYKSSRWSSQRSCRDRSRRCLGKTFLPMQLIYGGTTSQSWAKVEFPETFSLSANPKHYSNTEESVKLIEEIIIPYIEKERDTLNLSQTHPSLLIMDVFSGQMTSEVLNLLSQNDILLVRVPPNMTHLYQPLGLTINGHFKSFMKKRFSEWSFSIGPWKIPIPFILLFEPQPSTLQLAPDILNFNRFKIVFALSLFLKLFTWSTFLMSFTWNCFRICR